MSGLTLQGLMARPGLRTLALASLALNLFLAAMLVGMVRHPPPPPYQPMPDRFVERVAADLSEADAQRLRAAFEPLRPRYAELSREYREAGQRVRELLQSDRYAPEALRDATDSARAKRRQIGDLTEETVLSVLPGLSPAGRLRLVGGRGP
ncbi:periplasmic heavy metal sensor [Azospirillum picis]|uniref:Membrane protein n=1 Tax=Azospirillum picis TaxID=488438 RepID=A0ABU0MR78_9PROT|nr:periplasmic heavy metal sensor [Azospirillum picis]MBP2302145.1 putative membrane protein [Azospirillum picis]MDQ0535724.1 putative membrane protein [Azospirillum picis]